MSLPSPAPEATATSEIAEPLVPSTETALIRNQIRVLDIAQSFLQSEILRALLQLQIFELLDQAPQTITELAGATGARPDYLARLLEAGRMLKLLETPDGRTYRLSPASQAILAPSAGENYLGNWIRNLDYFSGPFRRLGDAVQTGRPIGRETHFGESPETGREFTLAMHNYASRRGKEFADTLDTTGCRNLLDLGCGPGTYAFCLGLKNPSLQLHLLDLPQILETAREIQARYAVTNEVHYHGQDAADEISGSYDLVLVSNILHMLGERASRSLIRRLYANVAPGGSLIVQAMFLEEPSEATPQRWPILVDLLNLCLWEEGRNHTVAETRQWMEEAGFTGIEYHQMKLFNVNSFLRGYRV